MLDINVVKKFHSFSGEIEFKPNLTVKKGSLSVFFGRSGSGKTTLLRMIAGLTAPDSGEISCGGILWSSGDRLHKTPQDRNIGFVSQDLSLFAHLTVEENVFFANNDKNEAERLINVTGLSGLRKRHPAGLSGGQKQRVAFVRALAKKPGILLLDEPMSSLDNETRAVIRAELETAVNRGITVIMVTHDVPDIFKLADTVFVIESGLISRVGSPTEVFISRITSNKFVFTGEVLSVEKADVINIITVTSEDGATEVVATDDEASSLNPGDRVLVAAKAFQPVLIKI
jgi:molybdate transport system ATP-binding protein